MDVAKVHRQHQRPHLQFYAQLYSLAFSHSASCACHEPLCWLTFLTGLGGALLLLL